MKNIEFLADPAADEARVGCHPFIAASFVSSASTGCRNNIHAEALHRDLRERSIDLLVASRFDPGGDEDPAFETAL